jgi:hypothetical protein
MSLREILTRRRGALPAGNFLLLRNQEITRNAFEASTGA